MRHTLIAVTTAATLTLGSAATAHTALAAEVSSDAQKLLNPAGSSYYTSLTNAAASSDSEDANRFSAVVLDFLVGFGLFAVVGSLYGELAQRIRV